MMTMPWIVIFQAPFIMTLKMMISHSDDKGKILGE